MDKIDRLLLDRLQKTFPIQPRPYKELGKSLGISEDEVIKRISLFKEKKIVRQISAIFNTGALGYKSSLVAMSVPASELEKAAAVINEYPGVSHNYLRSGRFNLWFTIAVPPNKSLEVVVRRLSEKAGGWPFLILPAVKKYKLAVVLDILEDGDISCERDSSEKALFLYNLSDHKFVPTDRNVEIVRAVQEDLPLSVRPFAEVAKNVDLGEEDLIDTLHDWISKGWIRRFAAVLNHREAGFVANGMVVWKCPDSDLDRAGMLLASNLEVSHCYARPSYPEWPYNLYAMIHGKSKDECRNLAEKLSEQIGIKEHLVLFSSKEFKKIRLKLFWDEGSNE